MRTQEHLRPAAASAWSGSIPAIYHPPPMLEPRKPDRARHDSQEQRPTPQGRLAARTRIAVRNASADYDRIEERARVLGGVGQGQGASGGEESSRSHPASARPHAHQAAAARRNSAIAS